MEWRRRKLEQKIGRVEEQIDTCSDLHEKAQLRDEKARLLGVKLQLREQILQGRDRCTEFDWLRQDLPSWDSGSRDKTLSATHRERMYTSVRVEYWDVMKDIEDYLNEADRLKRVHRKADNATITRGERNLKEIAVVVVSSTSDYLSKKRSGSSVIYAPKANLELPPGPSSKGGNSTNPDESKAESRDVQKCLFYARPPRVDIVVRCNGKDATVYELKNGGLGLSRAYAYTVDKMLMSDRFSTARSQLIIIRFLSSHSV